MNQILPELVQKYSAVLAPQVSDSAETPTLIWENEAGGRTYRQENLYLKWNPADTDINLHREFLALQWLVLKHRTPLPVHYVQEEGNELLVTQAIAGQSSHASWGITHPRQAIESMARGLRQLHMIKIENFPLDSTNMWYNREIYGPESESDHVLVHGDACAPNTIIHQDGSFSGNVDFGDLGLGSRWADLAVGSLCLEWNFLDCGLTIGEKEDIFFSSYGISPHGDAIAHYRRLWKEYS